MAEAREQRGQRAARAPPGARRRYGDRRADPADRAARTPFTHTEHGVAAPDPYHWLGGRRSRASGPPRRRAGFYDASVAHLDSLRIRPEGGDVVSVPTADESARWSRRRFTYWTRHPVNSDYAELVATES